MPRPRAITRSDDALLSNAELARVFREIGDMLEIMGEVVYKAVAYRRVADAIERYPEDVAALYRRGTPPKLPGAGPALSTKLAELSDSGSLAYHDRLRAQVPQGLLDMLQISGVGPRTVKLLHEERGIDSVDALRAAAEDGQLRGVKGLSERTEQNILAGIEGSDPAHDHSFDIGTGMGRHRGDRRSIDGRSDRQSVAGGTRPGEFEAAQNFAMRHGNLRHATTNSRSDFEGSRASRVSSRQRDSDAGRGRTQFQGNERSTAVAPTSLFR